ncbi:T9SS type A sorting domain-containing protein [Hymenobacter busanensis]|nr:T9SS type A sorting domain-containing protein [Hymenobacter busanensis]QHJ07638.1 T9SS type A sorting domain-containing protein [Hymenobacter busanensis]
MRKAAFLTFSFAFIGLAQARAQEAIVPAGGDASGSGGNVSYSLNYVAYTTGNSSGGSVSPGLLHPIETFVLSSKVRSTALKYEVYPNPTSGGVTLQAAGAFLRNYSYRLCDLQGRVVESQPLGGPTTGISLEQLPAAVYILTVSQGNKATQTFKIIKH